MLSADAVATVMLGLGMVLVSFSPSFVGGVLAGSYLRVHRPFDPKPIEVPWDAASPPRDTAEAWEWMKLAMQASEKGVPPAAVRQAYQKSIEKPKVELPWGSGAPPTSVADAIRWIQFAAVAEANGLAPADVKSIYAIAVAHPQPEKTPGALTDYSGTFGTKGTTKPAVVPDPSPEPFGPIIANIAKMEATEAAVDRDSKPAAAVPEPDRRSGDVFERDDASQK
jgi:hypothetical protein